jgi:metal-responsive CopG/Arc/MetJ family transcriptional regulator
MQQVKVSVDKKQIDFLNKYHSYGFKDKSSLVRKAIDKFKEEIEAQKLKRSAELYAEVYSTDSDLRELTESALSEWPE